MAVMWYMVKHIDQKSYHPSQSYRDILCNNITWCGCMTYWYIAFAAKYYISVLGTFSFVGIFSQYLIITGNSPLKNRTDLSCRGFKIKYSFYCNLKCASLWCRKAFLSEWVSVWTEMLPPLTCINWCGELGVLIRGSSPLFMPPLRHFNLKMLNILISLFPFCRRPQI